MATIIDSLIVSLGLDPAGFTKGQKKAVDSLKGLEKESNKTSKKVQSDANKGAQSFSKFRNEVLALTSAFLSVGAIKSFSENITRSDAAMGFMAKNLGMSTTELSSWSKMAEKAGGSAEGIIGSMKGLTERVQQLALTGEGAESFKYFTSLGIAITDSSGAMRSMNDILLDSADALSKMTPTKAQAWGKGMGFDEGTINVLMQGRGAVEKLLEDQKKLAVVTEKDAKLAQQRRAEWAKLSDTFENIGRNLLTQLSPTIEQLAKDFAEWMSKIKPKEIETFVEKSISGFKSIVDSVGGLTNAIEILFGLWIGSKFAAMIAGIAQMTTALGGAGIAAKGLSGLVKGGLVGAAFAGGSVIGEEINKHLSTETKDAIGGTVSNMVESVKGFGEKTKTKALDVINFFKGKGWTPEQAAGIAANIQQESGFEAGIKQKGGGPGFGLLQWEGPRQAEFKKWAGKDIRESTAQEQLEFANYELTQGTEKAAGKAIMATKTAEEAGAVTSAKYVRPKEKEKEMAERAATAQGFFKSLLSTPSMGSMTLPGHGLQQARNSSNVSNTSNTKTDVSVGQVVVNTQATDAPGIARDIGNALQSYTFANQAQTGLI